MKQPFRLLALLLGLVLLMSLLSPLALAEEPEKEVPDGEELIATPEEDDGFIDIGEDEAVDEYWEELRNFWGAEYGWLRLELDEPLLELVGHQRRGVTCACYSLAYCRTLLDGERHLFSEYNLGRGEEDAWCSWLDGDYESNGTRSANEIYERLYSELCKGKPSVIQIKGPNTQQHYVAVVGFENVVNGQPLSTYNFLILDPCAASFEPLNMGQLGYDFKRNEDGNFQIVCDMSGKALAFEAHSSSYLSRCERSYAERELHAHRALALMSLPCERKLDGTSEKLGTLKKGALFHVSALVKNTAGEYWYRGTDEEGTLGYARCEGFGSGLTVSSDFASEGVRLPGRITAGESLPLSGEIGAGHPAVLRVAIYDGEGGQTEPLAAVVIEEPARFWRLEELELDELHTERLAEGRYTLRITALFPALYCTDGKAVRSVERTAPVFSDGFTVAAPDDTVTIH